MLDGVLATLAYVGGAAALLLAGFVVVDLLTPGKLDQLRVAGAARRTPSVAL